LERGSGQIIKYILPGLAVLLLSVSTAAAQKTEQPAKPEPIRGYIPVQLPSFSVPVLLRGGWLGRGTISMFLVVRGQKRVETFCRYMPRVREAITLTVDQNPIPITNRKYQLGKIGSLLHQAINKALPKPLVIRLHLLPIVRPMGKDAVVLELPGTDSTCMALKEIPEEVLAKFRGDDPEAKTSSLPDPEAEPEPRAETKPALPASEVRIVPKILSPRPVPAETKASKIDVPAWKTNAQGQKFQDPSQCLNLMEVWAPGYHKAGGRTYWLSRAFTLDDDNDGAVDNVGFVLKAEDRPDLYIYYFPGQGRQSVVTVPTLRLKDDRDVLGVCFGQEEYPKSMDKSEQAAFKAPDLSSQLAARDAKAKDRIKAAGEPGKQEAENPFLSGPGLVFAIAGVAGVLLIAGGGVGYVIARRRSERRRKERRMRKERRLGGDRRERQEPPDGDERRKGEDRRDDDERRQDDNRRK